MTLECPRCGLAHEDTGERFCPACGMPLVHPGPREQDASDEAHERARKVRPQYARGEMVKVAWGRNQAEGELIQGLLLERGIPSMLRRARGFDVPDMLAAGPRDVLVPESGAEAAREILDLNDVPQPAPGLGTVSPVGALSPRWLALWIGLIALAGFLFILLGAR